MPARTAIPGTCNLCQATVAGNRIRRHLLRCIEARTGLSPSRDPQRRVRRRNALKTAYISVSSKEQPHWLELGVRSDATLDELDRFLRALWLECCGHMSHFEIDGVTYSAAVPKPGDDWIFEPMYDGEETWRHMGKNINTAIPVLTKFQHEFDYGSPTELVLEHVAVFGELAQWLVSSQPWHGGKIVILARNDSVRPCLRCRRPAQWKSVPELYEDEEYYDEYDPELYEDEGVMSAEDLDPVTFCDDCAPEDGEFLPLPNSPREGIDCYDNVHSWQAWPLPDYNEC